MNRQEFSNNWNEIKNSIKEKWNKLNQEDINQINGNFEHLVSLLQKKYGYHRDQILNELESFKTATASTQHPRSASAHHSSSNPTNPRTQNQSHTSSHTSHSNPSNPSSHSTHTNNPYDNKNKENTHNKNSKDNKNNNKR